MSGSRAVRFGFAATLVFALSIAGVCFAGLTPGRGGALYAQPVRSVDPAQSTTALRYQLSVAAAESRAGAGDAAQDCRRLINTEGMNSAQSPAANLQWRRLASNTLDLGFRSGPHWLRLRIPADRNRNRIEATAGDDDRFVVFQQQMVAEVVYCAPDRPQFAGAVVPFPEWPQKLRFPAFRLRAPAAATVDRERDELYYFRIRSGRILNFPVRLFFSLEDYLNFIQQRQIAQFSLLAVAALATLFYFVWFVVSGRYLYLYFAALLSTVTLNFFIVYGDAYIYLWPDLPAIQEFAVRFTTALGAFFAGLFSRPLLRSPELPRLDAGIRVVIAFQILSMICAFIPVLRSVNALIMFASPFAALFLVLPAAWIQLRRGQLPARLYLLGWLFVLVAFLLNASNFLGWTEYNVWFVNAPVLAAPLALLCFAIGSYRRGQADSRAAAELRERYAELTRRLQSGTSTGGASRTVSAAPGGTVTRAGAPQTQLRGVDVAAKKRLLLEAMRGDRLYELEELRLESLAAHVGLRSHQLSELLNQELNISFSEFVRKFRVDAARAKLADSGNTDSLLQIGLSVGFGSKTAFNRGFVELTGTTPGRYREQMRASG